MRVCLHCQNELVRRVDESIGKYTARKFCSLVCYGKMRSYLAGRGKPEPQKGQLWEIDAWRGYDEQVRRGAE